MPSKEDLLLEKKRHNLKQKISLKELKLLKNNTPVQKIIGYIEMQNVKINLKHKVLIPRYETEELIELSYQFINEDSDVLDLCCGSGFIGLAIKKNTNAQVTMSDIDSEAISQSHYNKKINNLNDVKIIKSDLFQNIRKQYDAIISNPPYIPIKNILDESVLKHEPLHALYAEEKGNYFYKQILKNYEKYLKPGGILLFEISENNLEFFKKQKRTYNLDILKDINDKHRFVIIKSKK